MQDGTEEIRFGSRFDLTGNKWVTEEGAPADAGSHGMEIVRVGEVLKICVGMRNYGSDIVLMPHQVAKLRKFLEE